MYNSNWVWCEYDVWWTSFEVYFGKWVGHHNNPSYSHIHEQETLGM